MASREDLVSSGGSVFSSELLKTFLHQARYMETAQLVILLFETRRAISTLRYFFPIYAVRKIWRELLVLTPSKATLQLQFSLILHPSLS